MNLIMDKLHFKQGEIKELVQERNDLIVLHLTNGNEIHIKARPTNYGYSGIHDARIKEDYIE